MTASHDLVAEFACKLAEHGPRRVAIDELVSLLVELRPELATAGDRFTRLAEVVDALAVDGVLTPAKTLAVRQGLALPRSVNLNGVVEQKAPNPAATYHWLPVLGWCGNRWWAPAVFEQLKLVNEWLAGNRGRAMVPVRERSLEILGDDKALGRLLRGSLGRPEVVAALLVTEVHPPMAVDQVPGAAGRGILVVENGTTFHSLRRAAEAHAAEGTQVPWRWIGYGAGRQVASLVPSLAALEPDRIAYFGDLDPEGLTMAAEGWRASRLVDGLPELLAHEPLYEALLDVGRPQFRNSLAPWPEAGLAWLGPGLAERVVRRLTEDRWLAQEWVGFELLHRETRWLEETRAAG